MTVILQQHKVEAVISLDPKDVTEAIKAACKKLGRFGADVEYVLQQPLPCVTVEVRRAITQKPK
jgi:hypothetical protein